MGEGTSAAETPKEVSLCIASGNDVTASTLVTPRWRNCAKNSSKTELGAVLLVKGSSPGVWAATLAGITVRIRSPSNYMSVAAVTKSSDQTCSSEMLAASSY